jgi:uncharacterized membrane protein YesL
VAGSYVFFVMSALDVPTIRGQITSALLIGFGSLHWTVLGAVTVAVAYGLMFSFATPLLVIFGAGIPAAVVGLIVRGVFRELDATKVTTAVKVDHDVTPTADLPWKADQVVHPVKGIAS